jgi:hypothetical protein
MKYENVLRARLIAELPQKVSRAVYTAVQRGG